MQNWHFWLAFELCFHESMWFYLALFRQIEIFRDLSWIFTPEKCSENRFLRVFSKFFCVFSSKMGKIPHLAQKGKYYTYIMPKKSSNCHFRWEIWVFLVKEAKFSKIWNFWHFGGFSRAQTMPKSPPNLLNFCPLYSKFYVFSWKC